MTAPKPAGGCWFPAHDLRIDHFEEGSIIISENSGIRTDMIKLNKKQAELVFCFLAAFLKMEIKGRPPTNEKDWFLANQRVKGCIVE